MAMAGGYYQRAATTTAHAFVIIVIIIIYQGDDDDGGVRNLFSLTSWDRQTKNIQKKTSNSSQAECGEPERFEIVLKTNINPVMCEIYFQELTRAASAFICHYFSSNSSGYNRTLWLLFIKVSGKDGRFIKKNIYTNPARTQFYVLNFGLNISKLSPGKNLHMTLLGIQVKLLIIFLLHEKPRGIKNPFN